MDLTFTELECPNCKPIKMEGHGGRFGGRITSVNMKCPKCDLVLIIVPMRKDLQYSISATTEEERREQLIKKAKEDAEKALYEKIELIKTYKL